MGNPGEEAAAWCSRAAYGRLVLSCVVRGASGGAQVPYAGPDGSKTLPDGDAWRQFCVAWETSHPVWPIGFAEMTAQHNAARLSSLARRAASMGHAGQMWPSSSISVTSAAICERSDRVSVTCANSG